MSDAPSSSLRTVVVPLDGSSWADRAIPVAAQLVDPSDGRLVLVSITSHDRADDAQHHLAAVAGDIGSRLRVESTVVEALNPAVEIAAIAEAHQASVCMTSHGRGALRWAALGSVAEEVVACTTRPVLLVGPHCETTWTPGPGPVLVCHDGSALPKAVVDAACNAADWFHAPVALTTVIHPLDVPDAEFPDALFSDAERRLRARGCSVEHLIEQRHFPAGVIADVATDQKAPVIVMAAHSRGGVARIVIGSTTMAVVNLAPCPVIAVNGCD